ncbi:MAG: VWA domain-containing protein [Candidatus Woesearchaeota archaeon]
MIPTTITLLHPMNILWAIPLIALLIFLLTRNFVKTSMDRDVRNNRKNLRILLGITRTLIILSLVLALAQPIGQVVKSTQGNPRIVLLVDNSTSMEVLDTTFVASLKEALDSRVPTTTHLAGQGLESDIGNAVLGNLEQNAIVLIVSDGNPTHGPSLGDVALYATSLNATLSGISLSTSHQDSAISIVGPTTTLAEVENPFLVELSKTTPDKQIHVTVQVDGVTVLDQVTAEQRIEFRKAFREGEHRITATIEDEDYFSENNVFRKTVTAVPKPPVLLVTQKDDPIKTVLSELYDVTQVSTLPGLLGKYYAVVINDMSAENFRDITGLTAYLNDVNTGGNGLVVVGGPNSYDRGNYKDSLLETLLPVRVGTGTRKKGDANIALVIDISGASGQVYEKINGKLVPTTGVTSLDITKSLAVSVLDQLDLGNKAGAVAFASDAYLVQDIAPLYENKYALKDKLSRLKSPETGAQSHFNAGIEGAYQMLSSTAGDKNIIIFTDGRAYEGVQQQTLDAVREAARQGIKTYAVGVGVRQNVDNDFLTRLAAAGNGIYFPADQTNKITILFGQPNEIKTGDTFGLFVLNPQHFITQGLELSATLTGYNQVIPRSDGQLLVTTTGGDPALTVGRYGLGRVASITVYNGNNLGDVLSKRNSLFLTRTMNWAIGDPQRKEETFVHVEDTSKGESTAVRVRSNTPLNTTLNFQLTGEDVYTTRIMPTEEGFSTILGADYAVNAPLEYKKVGLNKEYVSTIGLTGGQMFSPTDVDGIVEFAKTVAHRTQIEKTSLAWYLLALAMAIYLLEIIIRRLGENRLAR